jgi:ribosomal protein L11 methyltransferase
VSWLSVRVRAPDDASRSAVAAALIHAGADGVQDLGDELLTFYPASADIELVRAAVREASPVAKLEVSPVASDEWATSWVPAVGIQRVGRISVAPPWLAAEARDSEHLIIIDPAMAFGTGEHETTRLMLRLMQGVIAPGDRVVDCGAGSAVLAIGSVVLGARNALAIESDADAIGNAEENIVRNGVESCVRVVEGDAIALLPLAKPVDVILANILSSVLVELSSAMRTALAPGGRCIVSGVLLSERESFLDALAPDGWHLDVEEAEGEWWSGVIALR